MWLDQADGFAEMFRGYLPYYLLVVFPIFIIMSPVNPVAASHEFSVYRMHQYDFHTLPHGCRSASFNLEGRSLTSWSMSRHCVVARIQDMTIEQYLEIRNKAGALLLIMPKNITLLTDEEKEHIKLLEMAMMQQNINIPVYFALWSPEFENIINDLQYSFNTDDKTGSALEAMVNTVSSNGYQIVVAAPTPQQLDSKPPTIHGKLIGSGSDQTIIISAHYDSSALVPDLSFGADSNASGVVALLELARIFSRLYATAAERGGPTILFLLTSTGHSLNYFASKKWLEEQLDTSDATLHQDVSFVMCLEAMASGPLSMHVSRPPKPGTATASLQARLKARLAHKKINLAADLLAWHHERFSIRRMPAFTLSSLQSHKDAARNTLLDVPTEAGVQQLTANIILTARALTSHIYNLTEEESDDDAIYDDVLGVDANFIKQWYNYLGSQPRAPHFITTSDSGVTGALERTLSQFMTVTSTAHTTDRREPEHALYSPTQATLFVYSVKPAVFDLFLTVVIVAYLSVIYFAIQYFPRFYEEYAKIVTGKAKVH